MDHAGVDFGLLSAWSAPHQEPPISNDEVAEWVSAHPTRFAGLAAVDLNRPVAAVRELRRCVNDLGFKGLRVIPWLWEAPPTDRRYYPLFAACVELGVPFLTQVGHTGPLRPSETGRPIPYIDQVAVDFPELVIVGGHIGYPWTEEMVAVARKHENVYIDTSAYTAKRYPPELVAYLNSRSGRRKVMFGTNYVSYGGCERSTGRHTHLRTLATGTSVLVRLRGHYAGLMVSYGSYSIKAVNLATGQHYTQESPSGQMTNFVISRTGRLAWASFYTSQFIYWSSFSAQDAQEVDTDAPEYCPIVSPAESGCIDYKSLRLTGAHNDRQITWLHNGTRRYFNME